MNNEEKNIIKIPKETAEGPIPFPPPIKIGLSNIVRGVASLRR